MKPAIFEPVPLDDYALLDSGGGEKLERFGAVVLRRPDPQALWQKSSAPESWSSADLTFVRESDRGGRWESHARTARIARGDDPTWPVRVGGGTFLVRPTPFKHVGIFPEQAPNWSFVERAARALGEKPRLLNLFGYSGVASVLAARAGCAVTHVDASKHSIAWTRENAAASGLAPDALRIVLDDALEYARREVRRGARYAGVLMDPPHYGRGPKGEKWQFEDDIATLVATVGKLLDARAFVVCSTYAIGCSPLALANLLTDLGRGELEAGELVLAPATSGSDAPRVLPAGYCARWSRGLSG
ncbi:MAG: SAM-dependent methyltransferase [Planctomycetota bacterium]